MGQQVKNLLRAQSKYGLIGSSAKPGKFFFEGHRSIFCIKVPFGIGHPHLHNKCSLHVCGRVQGSQIFKQNSIILIRSKVIVILPIWVSSALGGGAGGCGVSRVNNYSLYEFRSVQR